MTMTAAGTPVSDVGERIVAAADELYYARGFQAVGMDEVRSAAGVSLKRLYREFPSKEALVLAVLRSRHAMWDAGIAGAVEAADAPRDKLLAIYDYLSSWFADDSFRGCGFVNAFGELGTVFPSVAELAREHKESFQGYVAATAAISGSSDAALHARAAAATLIDAAIGS
jgi:AcrR family transcriptional regulator